jgi:hypothetical protein
MLCAMLLLSAVIAPVAYSQTPDASSRSSCQMPRSVGEVRPGAGGAPVDVEIELVLIDLFSIDDTNQNFLSSFVFVARWNDPRLSEAEWPGSQAACKLTIDNIWDPDIRLLNQRGLIREIGPRVEVSPNGDVVMDVHMLSTISSRLELRNFPFDEQALKMKWASFSYGPRDITLTVRHSRIEDHSDWSISGWSVLNDESSVSIDPLTVGESQFVRLDHVVSVARKPGYYLWNFGLPLCLIVMMAWTVFWLDPETSSGAQIGIATASTFTLIAFLIALRTRLPAVGYLTQLDKLSVYSTVLVFLALGEVVVTSSLAQRGRQHLARRIDVHARWIYLLAFAAGLTLVLAV